MDELLPMITEKDGIPVTTSKAVAEQFEKRHDSVIRDIENLLNLHKSVEIESDTTQEFLKQNFIEATYTDSRGRQTGCRVRSGGYFLTGDTSRFGQRGVYSKSKGKAPKKRHSPAIRHKGQRQNRYTRSACL